MHKTLLFMITVLALTGCAGGLDEAADREMLPVRCLDKPAPGRCGTPRRVYVYDYVTDRCREVEHGGCGTAAFATLADCISICVASGTR